MKTLLEYRERLKQFYGNNSLFIGKGFQFLLALITFGMINSGLGYMKQMTNPVVTVGLSIICMLLPVNGTVLIASALVLLHLYKLSLEIMLVTGAIMLVMYILYFRFVPKQGIVLLLTPIACVLKIPYVIPVALGLAATPISMVSVGCGITIYYVMHYVTVYAAGVTASDKDDAVTRVSAFVQNVLQNKQMILMIVAFAIVIAVVYAIRRQSFDHAWKFAIAAGILLDFVAFVIGSVMFDVTVDYGNLIIGSLVSLLLALILELFLFTVDYSRTKRVQYEDDEYYYYVKAVPKISISVPEKTVKRINRSNSVKDEKIAADVDEFDEDSRIE